MAQIANIVVKSALNADVTFTALVGASGDSPAVWRVNVAGQPPAFCPVFMAWQKSNKDGSVRRIEYKVAVPDVDPVTNKLVYKPLHSGVHYVPQGADPTSTDNLAHYVAGLLGSAAFLTALKSGYLPT